MLNIVLLPAIYLAARIGVYFGANQNFNNLNMKKLFIVLIALFCGLQAFTQNSLMGSVYDEIGEYLPGANVVLKGTDRVTSTDADGFYRFGNLKEGNYTVVVTYIGYATLVKTVLVKGQQTQEFMLTTSSINTQTVEVLSTWAGEKTPMTYTNVDKETLEKVNLGQDVPVLLQWTPSAVITSDAGAGVGYTGIRIRGSDPTRINVTINGIPLNDSESQGVFWVDLPDFVASTEQVQIQRGVGTSTNGAGAFGASINLSTAKIYTEPHATLSSSIGSFNTQKGAISFGSGLINDRFTFDGRLSSITSDGYIDRASADLESYFLSAAYLGDKNSLRLNMFSGHEVTYQAWNGTDPSLVNDKDTRTFNVSGTEKEGEPHDNEVDDYRQTHYQAMYAHELSPNTKLNLGLHFTHGEGFFEQYKADESLGDYGLENVLIDVIANDSVYMGTITETDLIRRRWLDNNFYGLTFGLNHKIGNADLTIGGAYNIYDGQHFGEVIWARYMSNGETGHRYYDNDANKTDFNIFTKVDYSITDKLNAYADLQIRNVAYDFENVEARELSDNLTFFNPKVGFFYDLNQQIDLYTSFGVANREPNRNDYTESTPESRPKAETLYNTELGARMSWKKATFGANLYHMLYNDQLVLTGELNDVGANVRINVPDSYRFGLELEGKWNFYKELSLFGNATFSQNKVKSLVEFVDAYDENFEWLGQVEVQLEDETDLAFSPNVIAAVGLNWEALSNVNGQSLEFNLQGKYVGEQFIDNSSDDNNKLDAYFYSDFRLTYTWEPKFADEVGLSLLVNNITNSLYSSNAWSYKYDFDGTIEYAQGFYPQATTNFLLGLTVKF